jgi:hypothetical protein
MGLSRGDDAILPLSEAAGCGWTCSYGGPHVVGIPNLNRSYVCNFVENVCQNSES